MQKKNILIVASVSMSLTHFRGDFILELIKNNFRVFTAAPSYNEDIRQKLIELGATPLEFNLQRTGLNPFKDIQSVLQLRKLMKDYNIDLVFPYTVKPVIYSSLAANSCKVPVVSLITGLGFAFTGLTLKARILQRLNEFLYKLSIRKNKTIIFQNTDDYNLFLERNIISKNNKVGFVSGSGVNFDKYTFRVNNKQSDNLSFLFVARLIEEKGIGLYVDAAKVLKKKYPNAEFHVIGIPESSPSAIKIEKLQQLHSENVIVYHGPQDNVPEHLYNSDIFVLPTYYREGIPRSILEALSVGLPIITTNTPGCKETVKNNSNGFLIPPQNLEALVDAMEFFLINGDKIKEMGINSRKYAEERFDVNIINEDLLKYINAVIS